MRNLLRRIRRVHPKTAAALVIALAIPTVFVAFLVVRGGSGAEGNKPELIPIQTVPQEQKRAEGSFETVPLSEIPESILQVVNKQGTATPISTSTQTPRNAPSPTPSPINALNPTPQASPTPTVSPEPTLEPSPTAAPAPTPSPVVTPTPSPQPSPMQTPVPLPTQMPSPTPSPTPSPPPSPTPSPVPPSPTPETGSQNEYRARFWVKGPDGKVLGGAIVVVDGERFWTDQEGYVHVYLEPGEHEAWAQQPGYKKDTKSFLIASADVQIVFQLISLAE